MTRCGTSGGGKTDVDVREFLDGFEEIAEVVDPGALAVELSRDLDENPILQAAAITFPSAA